MSKDEFMVQVFIDPRKAVLDLMNSGKEEDDDSFESIDGHEIGDIRELLGIKFKNVQCDGGGEGEGEMVSWVYALSVGDEKPFAHIELTGFYESQNGTTWDDEVHVVYPVQVLVTQYHALKN